MKKLIVALDFDKTLNTPEGKKLYWWLLDQGVTIYILTARNYNTNTLLKNSNSDLFSCAKMLGIIGSRIIFTNYKCKIWFVNHYRIDLLIDDNTQTNIDFIANGYGHKCTLFSRDRIFAIKELILKKIKK